MKKLLIVNNIPNPYRTFMFNKLHERGRYYGIEVTVAFQARREAHRPWKPEDFDMRFPHFFSRGLWGRRGAPVEVYKYTILNRDIIAEVASGRYDWIIMAPLMSVSNWIMSLLPARGTLKLLWSEANLEATRHMGLATRLWKRYLHMRYDARVCPGPRAVEYIHVVAPGLDSKPIFLLPNIVDTSLFRAEVHELRRRRDAIRAQHGVKPDQVLILALGQLVERKGYGSLIEAAARVPGAFRVFILGDGPLRQTWQARIDSLGLGDKVRLCGQMRPEQVAPYFAAADWFIHPALRDPSPLVVIEAANAGLPLAISEPTGNSPESVDPGINGYRFDPYSDASLIECLQSILDTPQKRREEMGAASAELARQRFDPDLVVDRLFQGMLALHAARRIPRH